MKTKKDVTRVAQIVLLCVLSRQKCLTFGLNVGREQLPRPEAMMSMKGTRLEIAPPATEQQVRQIEAALDFRLPEQFRQTLLQFSGRVDFFWFLRRNDNPPDPLAGVFCGKCS